MTVELYLNGNWTALPRIKQGLPIIERLDEELNTATVCQWLTENATPYQPFTPAKISIGLINYYYVIDSDMVLLMSSDPPLYQHNIGLIAIEKQLDKYLMPSFAITNSTDGTQKTLLEQLQRVRNIFPLETYSRHSSTRLFDIVADTELNKPAPQIFLNRPTIYQAISSVFKPLNAMPRAEAFASDLRANVGKKSFNKLNSVISLAKLINKVSSINSEYYTRQIECDVPNAVNEGVDESNLVVFPNKTSWVSLRSTPAGSVFSTDTAYMPLQFPIYKLVKAEFYAPLGIIDSNSQYATSNETGDITDFIYERKLYETLGIASSVQDFESGTRVKNNCIYYNYGDNTVDGFTDKYKYALLFSTSAIQSLFRTWLIEHGKTPQPTAIVELEDVLFRITYQPLFNTVVIQERDDISLFPYKMISNVNFSDNTVNLDRLGTNMVGLVNRLGNGDLTVKKRVKNWTDCWNVGDYTSDGWIITIVEKAFYNDYVDFTATFTKNYNRLSNYVGVDTQYRQYEIPRTGVTRHLKYDDYIIIGSDYSGLTYGINGISNMTCISSWNWLLKTFGSTDSNEYKIVGGKTTAFSENGESAATAVCNCASYSVGKSLAFTFGYDDTISAGNRIEEIGSHRNQRSVKYTLDNGEMPHMNFVLYSNASNYNNDIISAKANADSYPNGTSVFPTANLITNNYPELGRLCVYKDKSEIIKMTYQIHFVPKDDRFIITELLANNSALVREIGSTNMVLKCYQQLDKFDKSQTTIATTNELSISSVTYDSTNKFVKVQLSAAPTGYFALTDSAGNIYVASNDKTINTIYFAGRHFR